MDYLFCLSKCTKKKKVIIIERPSGDSCNILLVKFCCWGPHSIFVLNRQNLIYPWNVSLIETVNGRRDGFLIVVNKRNKFVAENQIEFSFESVLSAGRG